MEGEQKKSIFCLEYENILRKIFGDIRRSQRWNLAATSKACYATVCGMDEKKFTMVIKPLQLEDSATFASIINCCRVFDEIKIVDVIFTDENLKMLKLIAEKHGASVRKITVEFDDAQPPSFQAESLHSFFKLLPNLKEIIIYDLYLQFKNMIGRCDPVLKNIQSLVYEEEYQGEEGTYTNQSFNNFTSLIAPDTVEEFSNFQCFTKYKDFIRQQSNMKRIRSIRCETLDASVFDHLKLEKLSVLCPDEDIDESRLNSFWLKIVNKHKTLKELNSGRVMKLSAQLVEAITKHLEHLQSFSIFCTNENANMIHKIDNLKKLEKLNIENFSDDFNRNDVLLSLTRKKMDNLQTFIFNAWTCEGEFDGIMKNIGQNWENIEVMKIHNCRCTMNAVLENLPKLKHLVFNFPFGQHVNPMFTYNSQTYPLVKNFESYRCSDTSFIYSFNIFPNVSRLYIKSCNYAGLVQLNGLLSLKKLKILVISFKITSRLIMPSTEEVAAIKQLVQSLSSYRISFNYDAPDNFQAFIDSMAHQLGEVKYKISTYGEGTCDLTLSSRL